MPGAAAETILSLLENAGFGRRSIVAARPVGGGCISTTCLLTLDDHRRVFLKTDRGERLEMFECEAEGLRALRAVAAIGVAEPIAVGHDAATDQAIFLAQAIDVCRPGEGFFSAFGRQLAELHRRTVSDHCGWHRDNFLGAARQPNPRSNGWVDFVAEHRLGYQIRWAKDQGCGNGRLYQSVERVIGNLDRLLDGAEEPPVLLHGDLWSGNYLADADGRPMLIDPAVYYGHREAEFGMLKLFGGCPAEFYDAYQQCHPLVDGWQKRCEVYILYHLLNHLNLFGGRYLAQCQSVADQLGAV